VIRRPRIRDFCPDPGSSGEQYGTSTGTKYRYCRAVGIPTQPPDFVFGGRFDSLASSDSIDGSVSRRAHPLLRAGWLVLVVQRALRHHGDACQALAREACRLVADPRPYQLGDRCEDGRIDKWLPGDGWVRKSRLSPWCVQCSLTHRRCAPTQVAHTVPERRAVGPRIWRQFMHAVPLLYPVRAPPPVRCAHTPSAARSRSQVALSPTGSAARASKLTWPKQRPRLRSLSRRF